MPSVSFTRHVNEFPAGAVRRALDLFGTVTRDSVPDRRTLSVRRGGERWKLTETTDFFALVEEGVAAATCRVEGETDLFSVAWPGTGTMQVDIALASLNAVQQLVDLLKEGSPSTHTTPRVTGPTVFVGHGRGSEWRQLQTFLRDDLDMEVLAYEDEPRTGQYPAEVLSQIGEHADFAVLVLTPDWIDQNGVPRAGENVVHETGLFQAWLGRHRALLLRHEWCADFANIRGLRELQFPHGKIERVFDGVAAALKEHDT